MAVPTPNPLSLAPTALKAVQDFRARNEVRVLFGLLKKELAGRPNFPWKQVERLALDPSTRGFFLNLIDDGRVDQQALRSRLVDLCDPGAYGASREALADEVLAAILEKAPLAVRSDREATRNIVRGEIDPLYALIADLLGGPDPQDALRAPYLDLPEEIADGKGPPSLPLRAEYGVVPFRGREDELTRIGDWCAEEGLVSVAVIVAGPGAGKTRLAAQAAEAFQQAHGWVTGMLKPDLDGAMVEALATLDLPQLVVIDGAPSRGPEIAELLKALGRAERSTPVRLLLLARDDGEWREKELPKLLHGSGGPEIVFGSTRVWPLGSAAADLDARTETFHDAAMAFAEVFALSPEAAVEPDLTQELFAEILCVHLAALTSVAGDPEVLRGRVAADDLLEDLLAREAGYWDACPRPVGLAIDDPDVRARVVALATMTYADDEEQAAATLRAIPDLADASERERRAIARWLKKLYPASRRPTSDGAPQEQWFRPLRPDLIGEYLVADALMPVPELAVRLTAAATPDQLPQIIYLEDTMLGEMVDKGQVLPAQSCMEADGYDITQITPAARASYSVDGVLYPGYMNVSTPVIYYNKIHFEKAGLDPNKPPTTLAEVEEYAKILKDKGVSPKPMAFLANEWFFNTWMAGVGQEAINNDNGRTEPATEATFASPEVVGALAKLDEMNAEGLLNAFPVT